MTRPQIAAALSVAAELGHVLPLHPRTRVPLVAFDRATGDPETIAAWWARWPDAGYGVRADLARLVALDLEHPRKAGADGRATLRVLEARIGALPATREHATKSGGAHLVFGLPRGVALRAAQRLIRGLGEGAPGLDVVAGRAVLRWPPTSGYAVAVDAPVAPLPTAWIAALSEPPEPARPDPIVIGEGRERRYALAALEAEACELAQRAELRNCALTRAAFRLGQLCPPLAASEIEGVLLLALEANGALREHGRRACLGTIARGLRAGMKSPRTIRSAA